MLQRPVNSKSKDHDHDKEPSSLTDSISSLGTYDDDFSAAQLDPDNMEVRQLQPFLREVLSIYSSEEKSRTFDGLSFKKRDKLKPLFDAKDESAFIMANDALMKDPAIMTFEGTLTSKIDTVSASAEEQKTTTLSGYAANAAISFAKGTFAQMATAAIDSQAPGAGQFIAGAINLIPADVVQNGLKSLTSTAVKAIQGDDVVSADIVLIIDWCKRVKSDVTLAGEALAAIAAIQKNLGLNKLSTEPEKDSEGTEEKDSKETTKITDSSVRKFKKSQTFSGAFVTFSQAAIEYIENVQKKLQKSPAKKSVLKLCRTERSAYDELKDDVELQLKSYGQTLTTLNGDFKQQMDATKRAQTELGTSLSNSITRIDLAIASEQKRVDELIKRTDAAIREAVAHEKSRADRAITAESAQFAHVHRQMEIRSKQDNLVLWKAQIDSSKASLFSDIDLFETARNKWTVGGFFSLAGAGSAATYAYIASATLSGPVGWICLAMSGLVATTAYAYSHTKFQENRNNMKQTSSLNDSLSVFEDKLRSGDVEENKEGDSQTNGYRFLMQLSTFAALINKLNSPASIKCRNAIQQALQAGNNKARLDIEEVKAAVTISIRDIWAEANQLANRGCWANLFSKPDTSFISSAYKFLEDTAPQSAVEAARVHRH